MEETTQKGTKKCVLLKDFIYPFIFSSHVKENKHKKKKKREYFNG